MAPADRPQFTSSYLSSLNLPRKNETTQQSLRGSGRDHDSWTSSNIISEGSERNQRVLGINDYSSSNNFYKSEVLRRGQYSLAGEDTNTDSRPHTYIRNNHIDVVDRYYASPKAAIPRKKMAVNEDCGSDISYDQTLMHNGADNFMKRDEKRGPLNRPLSPQDSVNTRDLDEMIQNAMSHGREITNLSKMGHSNFVEHQEEYMSSSDISGRNDRGQNDEANFRSSNYDSCTGNADGRGSSTYRRHDSIEAAPMKHLPVSNITEAISGQHERNSHGNFSDGQQLSQASTRRNENEDHKRLSLSGQRSLNNKFTEFSPRMNFPPPTIDETIGIGSKDYLPVPPSLYQNRQYQNYSENRFDSKSNETNEPYHLGTKQSYAPDCSYEVNNFRDNSTQSDHTSRHNEKRSYTNYEALSMTPQDHISTTTQSKLSMDVGAKNFDKDMSTIISEDIRKHKLSRGEHEPQLYGQHTSDSVSQSHHDHQSNNGSNVIHGKSSASLSSHMPLRSKGTESPLQNTRDFNNSYRNHTKVMSENTGQQNLQYNHSVGQRSIQSSRGYRSNETINRRRSDSIEYSLTRSQQNTRDEETTSPRIRTNTVAYSTRSHHNEYDNEQLPTTNSIMSSTPQESILQVQYNAGSVSQSLQDYHQPNGSVPSYGENSVPYNLPLRSQDTRINDHENDASDMPNQSDYYNSYEVNEVDNRNKVNPGVNSTQVQSPSISPHYKNPSYLKTTRHTGAPSQHKPQIYINAHESDVPSPQKQKNENDTQVMSENRPNQPGCEDEVNKVDIRLERNAADPSAYTIESQSQSSSVHYTKQSQENSQISMNDRFGRNLSSFQDQGQQAYGKTDFKPNSSLSPSPPQVRERSFSEEEIYKPRGEDELQQHLQVPTLQNSIEYVPDPHKEQLHSQTSYQDTEQVSAKHLPGKPEDLSRHRNRDRMRKKIASQAFSRAARTVEATPEVNVSAETSINDQITSSTSDASEKKDNNIRNESNPSDQSKVEDNHKDQAKNVIENVIMEKNIKDQNDIKDNNSDNAALLRNKKNIERRRQLIKKKQMLRSQRKKKLMSRTKSENEEEDRCVNVNAGDRENIADVRENIEDCVEISTEEHVDFNGEGNDDDGKGHNDDTSSNSVEREQECVTVIKVRNLDENNSLSSMAGEEIEIVESSANVDENEQASQEELYDSKKGRHIEPSNFSEVEASTSVPITDHESEVLDTSKESYDLKEREYVRTAEASGDSNLYSKTSDERSYEVRDENELNDDMTVALSKDGKSRWYNDDILYMPKGNAQSGASVVAMSASSLLTNEIGVDFESAVKIVSTLLQQDGSNNDAIISYEQELENENDLEQELESENDVSRVEKMDSHLFTSVKSLENVVARHLKEVDTTQPLTEMNECNFRSRCALFVASAIIKAAPQNKNKVALLAAEAVLLDYHNVRDTDWLTDADSHLNELASQVSNSLSMHTLSSADMASLASIAILSQGAKCLAMERIRQKVRRAKGDSRTDGKSINNRTSSETEKPSLARLTKSHDGTTSIDSQKRRKRYSSKVKYLNTYNSIEDLGNALAQLDAVVPKSPPQQNDEFTELDHTSASTLKSVHSNVSCVRSNNDTANNTSKSIQSNESHALTESNSNESPTELYRYEPPTELNSDEPPTELNSNEPPTELNSDEPKTIQFSKPSQSHISTDKTNDPPPKLPSESSKSSKDKNETTITNEESTIEGDPTKEKRKDRIELEEALTAALDHLNGVTRGILASSNSEDVPLIREDIYGTNISPSNTVKNREYTIKDSYHNSDNAPGSVGEEAQNQPEKEEVSMNKLSIDKRNLMKDKGNMTRNLNNKDKKQTLPVREGLDQYNDDTKDIKKETFVAQPRIGNKKIENDYDQKELAKDSQQEQDEIASLMGNKREELAAKRNVLAERIRRIQDRAYFIGDGESTIDPPGLLTDVNIGGVKRIRSPRKALHFDKNSVCETEVSHRSSYSDEVTSISRLSSDEYSSKKLVDNNHQDQATDFGRKPPRESSNILQDGIKEISSSGVNGKVGFGEIFSKDNVMGFIKNIVSGYDCHTYGDSPVFAPVPDNASLNEKKEDASTSNPPSNLLHLVATNSSADEKRSRKTEHVRSSSKSVGTSKKLSEKASDASDICNSYSDDSLLIAQNVSREEMIERKLHDSVVGNKSSDSKNRNGGDDSLLVSQNNSREEKIDRKLQDINEASDSKNQNGAQSKSRTTKDSKRKVEIKNAKSDDSGDKSSILLNLINDYASTTRGENSISDKKKHKSQIHISNKSEEGSQLSMNEKVLGLKLSRSHMSMKMSQETEYLDMLISDVDRDDASRSVLHKVKSNISRSKSPNVKGKRSISRDRSSQSMSRDRSTQSISHDRSTQSLTKRKQVEKLPKPLPNITEDDNYSFKSSTKPTKPTGKLRPHLVSPTSQSHAKEFNEGKDESPKTKKSMKKKLRGMFTHGKSNYKPV